MFEYLSRWSYKAIRQGYPDYEQWFEACFTRAMGYNKKQFTDPLTENEVKHTAKSVAKWTHKHFSPSAFSAWQAKQGAKGGKVSKGGGRPTGSIDITSNEQTKPWVELGIGKTTYYKRKKLGLV